MNLGLKESGMQEAGGRMSIVAENIRKSYGRQVVLDDLSLEVPSQSFTTILAPTGSGKTTLLRVLAGIEKPDRGRVLYNGVDVTAVPVQKRGISVVYQDFINYPSMTVYENIASPLRVSPERIPNKKIDRRVRDIAELLKISHILNHIPEEVSGGEKQRTAIARALIKGSAFIFLDEPLANLDYKLREELRGELKTVFKGTTILYATPEPIDALSMSSHVGFLHEGKILQFGRIHEVYARPKCLEVGRYFNDPPMNILDARVVKRNGRIGLAVTDEIFIEVGGQGRILKDDEYIVGIRPQDLNVVQNRVNMLPFEATVDFTEIVGSFTTLHLVHAGKNLGMVIYQPEKSHRRGDKVKVFLDPHSIYVYGKKDKRIVLAKGEPVTGG
jgi:glycerol transport system ATP-binding protein